MSPPSPPRPAPARRRLLLAAAALLAFWAALALLPLDMMVAALRDWAAGHGLLGWAVFAVAYAALTYMLVPGALLMLAAGLAFGMSGVAPVLAGVLLSASAGFLSGRYFARLHVQRLVATRPRLAAIDDAVAHEGWLIALLLRLSGVIPFNLQSLALGASRMGFLPYLAASMAGVTPGAAAYVWAGTLGGAAAEGESLSAARWALLGLGGVATAVIVVLISRKAQKILSKYGVDEDAAP